MGNGLVRYKYCIGGKIYGYYVCDVQDFKKLWKKICSSVDWCNVELGVSGVNWYVCDCWVFCREWKIKGWYKNGWKFYKGV